MFPTSTLPLSPLAAPAGMGALIGVLALGVLVALLVGLALYRREQRMAPTIELPGADATTPAAERPARPRLSA